MRLTIRLIAVAVAVACVLGAVSVASAATVERVSDVNRYAGSVAIAAEEFGTNVGGETQWPAGLRHIVLASGEDRAAADPLAAAGLCGLYDAPMLLIGSASTDFYVKDTIRQMVEDATGPVVLHVVGGTVSIPQARVNDILSWAGAGLSAERITPNGNRYDLARAIAVRVADAWPSGEPPVVLVANGADPTKFFDALALSPIATDRLYPILLVKQDDIPDSTIQALATIDTDANIEIVVGGGPATVSDNIVDFFDQVTAVDRWSGPDRFGTAIAIAEGAIAEGWLARANVGVAAKLPDALTGGAMCGFNNGPLLLTTSSPLNGSTGNWLELNRAQISYCSVFGGIRSVTPTTLSQIDARLN